MARDRTWRPQILNQTLRQWCLQMPFIELMMPKKISRPSQCQLYRKILETWLRLSASLNWWYDRNIIVGMAKTIAGNNTKIPANARPSWQVRSWMAWHGKLGQDRCLPRIKKRMIHDSSWTGLRSWARPREDCWKYGQDKIVGSMAKITILCCFSVNKN